MRTMTLKKDRVAPGGVFTLQMTVGGDTQGPNEYPFFFFGGEAGSLPTNNGKLDTKGVGQGPVAMKHTDQSDALSQWAQDECSVPLAKGPGSVDGNNIVVTKDPFQSHKSALKAKLPVRLQPDNEDGEAFFVWMGTWMDDGDGVAEDPGGNEDDYFCQPPYTSLILAKGAHLPDPKF